MNRNRCRGWERPAYKNEITSSCITKLIYDNKIPVLDNFISKKHKGDINKLTKMVLDIIGGEDVEEK